MNRLLAHRAKCNVGILALLFLIALYPNAHAAWVLEYSGQISPTLHGDGFKRPTALSLDAETDELLVTDSGAVSLRVFNASDVFTFETNRLAGLSNPSSAIFDARGGFLFSDSRKSGGREIRRLNFLGEPEALAVERPQESWAPMHLLRTLDGNLLSIDTRQGLLCKHELPGGRLLWQKKIGDAEQTDLGFVLGCPAEGPDGRIYIPGGNLHRVLVFDAQGEALGGFGQFGTNQGKMIFPTALAAAPGGNLLVLDRLRHRVLIFDPEWSFLSEYLSFGAAPGQIYHPNSIACRPDGTVFISQGFEGRVQSYRLQRTEDLSAAADDAGLDMTHRESNHPGSAGLAPAETPRKTRWSSTQVLRFSQQYPKCL